jgi:hypothetical protein
MYLESNNRMLVRGPLARVAACREFLGLARHCRTRARPRLVDQIEEALRWQALRHFLLAVTPAALDSAVMRRENPPRAPGQVGFASQGAGSSCVQCLILRGVKDGFNRLACWNGKLLGLLVNLLVRLQPPPPMRGNIQLIKHREPTAAHASKWTVVVDLPRAAPTLTLFDTQADADAEIIRLREGGVAHVFAVPPVPAWGGRPTVGA